MRTRLLIDSTQKLAGEEGLEPSPAEPTKRCTRCGEMKPLDEFYRRSKASDRRSACCKSCAKKYRHHFYEIHQDREKHRHQQRKISVVAHYSNGANRCACCDESDIRFLTIDHINGNGSEHRKSIGCRSGSTFYDWLIREGMPKGYQVLCYNCNIARAFYGICPHQMKDSNSAEGMTNE